MTSRVGFQTTTLAAIEALVRKWIRPCELGNLLLSRDVDALVLVLHAAWEREHTPEVEGGDVEENTTDNPRSWVAWKRLSDAAEVHLKRADGALADAATVPTGDIEHGIRLLTEQRDAAEARAEQEETYRKTAEEERDALLARVKELEQDADALKDGCDYALRLERAYREIEQALSDTRGYVIAQRDVLVLLKQALAYESRPGLFHQMEARLAALREGYVESKSGAPHCIKCSAWADPGSIVAHKANCILSADARRAR